LTAINFTAWNQIPFKLFVWEAVNILKSITLIPAKGDKFWEKAR
jgi:hypothetical protein